MVQDVFWSKFIQSYFYNFNLINVEFKNKGETNIQRLHVKPHSHDRIMIYYVQECSFSNIQGANTYTDDIPYSQDDLRRKYIIPFPLKKNYTYKILASKVYPINKNMT